MAKPHEEAFVVFQGFWRPPDLGQSPANIALAWLLHNPVVTAPIIRPRTVEQLKENKQAPEIILSEETLKQLDEIFPGPGGEAPKAYAW